MLLSAQPKLPLDFYQRNADVVAKALLGKQLLVKHDQTIQRSRIVETEAYMGSKDLASHASKGRTRRTEVLFGPAGVIYVYLIYGMYDMFNLVVSQENSPQAVLIRAVEPLENITGSSNGPGKLCKSLGITRKHNGVSVLGSEIWLEDGPKPKPIITTTRIGVDYAKEWAKKPLRFYDADSLFVSRKAES
jgi:DNA-3-methyladenine glycosylase